MIMAHEYDIESEFNKRYNLLTRKIVRLLSENSRMSIAEISKRLNVSRPTIKERINRLEKDLGMRYTIEINEEALGLTTPHLIEVRFKKKPDRERIRALLLQSYIPQAAFFVDGDYEMVIYANALSGDDYVHWNIVMMVQLSEYGVTWHPSEMAHRHLGFFQLRNEAIKMANIDENSKRLLMRLNENSRVSFQQLAKELGMHFNTVKYNFDKLAKSGYIRRYTITLDPVKDVSLIALFDDYTPSKGFESASAKARQAIKFDEENPLISRYLLSSTLIGSHTLFILSAFDSRAAALRNGLNYHKEMYAQHGAKRILGEVTDVVLGRLPIRSVDIKSEYKTIVWMAERNMA
jgi:DNA-binding Lrp family transcriptional regulator